jgi:hypothetical protein
MTYSAELALPATDAPKLQNGDVTLAYYDNDLVKSISQNSVTTTFTLDALDRRSTETVTDTSGSKQISRHYTDGGDNPTWVTEGTTTQRYAELIGGDLALAVAQDGPASLTLANPTATSSPQLTCRLREQWLRQSAAGMPMTNTATRRAETPTTVES